MEVLMHYSNKIEPVPEDKPCRWQDAKKDCWYEMPDSKLPCEGKCQFYEFTGETIKV